jgi:hypothetical protein
MFLLFSAIAGMALVLNNQNEIFATPRQQSGERSSVTLPPLQSGANLFFVTIDSATLYTSAIDDVWDAASPFKVIRPSDAEELIAFGDLYFPVLCRSSSLLETAMSIDPLG